MKKYKMSRKEIVEIINRFGSRYMPDDIIHDLLLTKPSTASSEKCKRCGCNGEIHSGVCLTCHYELSHPTPPKKKIEKIGTEYGEWTTDNIVKVLNQIIDHLNQ